MQQPNGATIDATEDVSLLDAVIDSTSLVSALDRAMYQATTETARLYPRDVVKCLRELTVLATISQDVAESMFYSLPRKERGRKKMIEGPSIRFAELVVYTWGNVRSDGRIVGIDEAFVVSQGTCLDLERNTSSRVEVRRRITGSDGRRYNDDMIVTTSNAACSIALRNAIFDVVPFSLVRSAYEAARKKAAGQDTPLETRVEQSIRWFRTVGAPLESVLSMLGRGSPMEITEADFLTLLGVKNAIQDGDTTVEEAFSRPRASDLNAALAKAREPGEDDEDQTSAL
jgi:hypothetical protein